MYFVYLFTFIRADADNYGCSTHIGTYEIHKVKKFFILHFQKTHGHGTHTHSSHTGKRMRKNRAYCFFVRTCEKSLTSINLNKNLSTTFVVFLFVALRIHLQFSCLLDCLLYIPQIFDPPLYL